MSKRRLCVEYHARNLTMKRAESGGVRSSSITPFTRRTDCRTNSVHIKHLSMSVAFSKSFSRFVRAISCVVSLITALSSDDSMCDKKLRHSTPNFPRRFARPSYASRREPARIPHPYFLPQQNIKSRSEFILMKMLERKGHLSEKILIFK